MTENMAVAVQKKMSARPQYTGVRIAARRSSRPRLS